MDPLGTPGPVPGRPGPTAGWYPDPSGAPQQRYWDGIAWTQQTAPSSGAPATPVPAARRGWMPWAIAAVCALLMLALLVAWSMRPGREGQPGQPGQSSNRSAAMESSLILEPGLPR